MLIHSTQLFSCWDEESALVNEVVLNLITLRNHHEFINCYLSHDQTVLFFFNCSVNLYCFFLELIISVVFKLCNYVRVLIHIVISGRSFN